MTAPIRSEATTVAVALGARSYDIVIGFFAFGKSHDGAREVGTAAVVPESGLDDFDGAPVVRGEDRLIKLLEPERLDFHLAGLQNRFLAQGTRRQIRKMGRVIFHSGNLIPSRLKS